MSKKNFIIAAFLIVLMGTAYIQFKDVQPKKEILSPAQVTITQIISVNGKQNKILTKQKVGTSALQLLSTSHKIEKKGEKENTFITSIDGEKASVEQREFWAFYVNEKQAEVGAGSYILKNNDTIEWKIEKY